MAKASSTNDSLDTCITCSTKYNRIRPSLCQCKHCSESFCFDCMKDHNDEIQQGVARAIDQYNEVKDFLKNKREWIKTEAIKSKEQINEWLTKYINDLKIEKERFDMDIDKEQKQAQKFVDDIEAQLSTCSSDIEGLTKNSRVESTHMKTLLEKLTQLTQPLSSLTIMKEFDLPSTMPKYQHKFHYSFQSQANGNTDRKESKTTDEPKMEDPSQSSSFVSSDETSDIPWANENYFLMRDKLEFTSYVINCMASDGINIMYSTIEDPENERIAYCYLNTLDSLYAEADPDRVWNQSRIVDMIWWKNIGKFVCATENKIFTVEYHNKRFKILQVINERWLDVRVAANNTNIWFHIKEKILIYNTNFALVRSIDFQISNIITRESFCITDNYVAFLVIRGDQTRSNVLQVRFYDINMVKLRPFDLGVGISPCMIRSDGTNRFVIAGGENMFYTISSRGGNQVKKLENEASCLAIVNSRNIIFTKSRSEVEVVQC